jgi:hypothetical protein
MVIDRMNQACGYVMGGRFRPFDSAACLLADLRAERVAGRPPSEIYFADFVTGEFLRAQEARFLLTAHRPTVMNAGVLTFRDTAAAESHRTEPDERIVDWKGLRMERGSPDRTVRLRLSGPAIDPDRFRLEAGELAELRIQNDGPAMHLAVRGYEEVGAIRVPGGGEVTRVRFWAGRPGRGFPVVCVETGATLGRMLVSGAHTQDEEARMR